MNSRDREMLTDIKSLLIRLDAAVVVRDPGSARAAEAFDGLRKQLAQSSKSRRLHQAHLLSLQDSLDRGASIELIRDRITDFMMELGIGKLTDTNDPSFFDVFEGEGLGLECVEPAYVEVLENGQTVLVRLGKARRIHLPESAATIIEVVTEVSTSTMTETNSDVEEIAPDHKFLKSSWRIALIATLSLLIGVLVGSTLGNGDSGSPSSPNTTNTTQDSITPATTIN